MPTSSFRALQLLAGVPAPVADIDVLYADPIYVSMLLSFDQNCPELIKYIKKIPPRAQKKYTLELLMARMNNILSIKPGLQERVLREDNNTLRKWGYRNTTKTLTNRYQSEISKPKQRLRERRKHDS